MVPEEAEEEERKRSVPAPEEGGKREVLAVAEAEPRNKEPLEPEEEAEEEMEAVAEAEEQRQRQEQPGDLYQERASAQLARLAFAIQEVYRSTSDPKSEVQ